MSDPFYQKCLDFFFITLYMFCVGPPSKSVASAMAVDGLGGILQPSVCRRKKIHHELNFRFMVFTKDILARPV